MNQEYYLIQRKMTNKSEKEFHCKKCSPHVGESDVSLNAICDGSCPCHTPKPEVGQREEGWVKGFDEHFCEPNENKAGYRIDKIGVKHFIRNLLKQDRQSLIRRVDAIKQYPQFGTTYGDTTFQNEAVVYGYNEAIDDIIRILSEK